MATLVGSRMTYAELTALPDNGVLYELLDGVLVTRASPTRRHQLLVGELYTRLRPAQDDGLGDLVLGPFDVVFDPQNATLPDLIFVRAEHTHFLTETGCFGAPDLIVEVLSPTSLQRDLEEKRRTYERFGVASYWVLDPEGAQIRCFDLVRGHYEERPVLGHDGVLASALFPWLQVSVGDLFAAITLAGRHASQPKPGESERVRALEEQHRRRRQHDPGRR